MASSFVVIGDLGGTNCRLELLELPADPHAIRPSPVHRAKYPSKSASNLTELLQRFVAEAAVTGCGTHAVALFSIAVCGPVTDGKSVCLAPAFGEGGWHPDANEMQQSLGARVVLLNDFHSVGLSL